MCLLWWFGWLLSLNDGNERPVKLPSSGDLQWLKVKRKKCEKGSSGMIDTTFEPK